MGSTDFGKAFCSAVAGLALATSASAQFGGFAAPSQFPVGDSPQSIAVGDLDGDGDLDLAVAIDTVNTFDNVAVLRNNGDGTFAPPELFGVGTLPKSIALGDMDGDEVLDVAVANQGTGDVSILLNNGDGTFAPEVFFSVGTEPVGIVLGDLNGDGDLDVATANIGSDNVSILINNGDGTLAPLTTIAVGTRPTAIAIGDLDGDGDRDLAVTLGLSDQLVVLLNLGNGFFAAPVNYPVGNFPFIESVAMGDLNGDGDLDVAVANSLDLTVSVLLGNGDGTLADAVDYSTAGANASGIPISIKIGDLDGDGDLDLATAEGPPLLTPSDTVAVLQNNGEGVFAPGINFSTGTDNTPISLVMGDLDGDGVLDLATANISTDDVAVLLNLSNPIGGITPVARIDVPAPFDCVCDTMLITGVADVPGGDFERCTMEYSLASGGPWTLIGQFFTPVPEPGGPLVNWNTSGLPENFYFLRLTVENGSGLDTSVTVIVWVSKTFDTVAYTVPAISGGNVCPDGTVWDNRCGANSYTIDFAPVGTGDFQPVDPGNPVYEGNRMNERLAVWDSPVVLDGDYTIRTTGTNGCGHQASQSLDIAIDNTPPVAAITGPLNCACLDGVVEIRGTANDTHLRNWLLQYTGGEANGWVTIASGDGSVTDNMFGVWDTTGLIPCAYTVRLRVYDWAVLNCNSAIKHISEYTISVDVGLCDTNFDSDGDGDVDLIDFSAFQDDFTGPLP